MLFKLSNLNSNLALTLGYLNPVLNNSALLLNLRATLPIWSIRFYKSALSSFVTLFLLNLSEVVDLRALSSTGVFPDHLGQFTSVTYPRRYHVMNLRAMIYTGFWAQKRTKLVCVRTKLKKCMLWKVHVIISSMAKSHKAYFLGSQQVLLDQSSITLTLPAQIK